MSILKRDKYLYTFYNNIEIVHNILIYILGTYTYIYI